MRLPVASRSGIMSACGALLMVVLISMIITNPTQLGPTGVTLWFLGFWVVLAANIAGFKYLLLMRFGSETTRLTSRKVGVTSLRHGILLGGAVTIWLALSSLQQLDIRDIGLVIALGLMIEVVARARR